MAALNWAATEQQSIKPDYGTITHYNLDSRLPAQFWRAGVFAEAKVQRDPITRDYQPAEPYWIFEPLQWLTFKTNRADALSLKVIEYSRKQADVYYMVATPPYKKKTNFKTEAELISYVQWEDVQSYSKTVPASGLLNLIGLIKYLQCFQELKLKTEDDIRYHLNIDINVRMQHLNKLDKEVRKVVMTARCPDDEAMQVAYNTRWDNMKAPMLKHLTHCQDRYNKPLSCRIVMVEKVAPPPPPPPGTPPEPPPPPLPKETPIDEGKLLEASAAIEMAQAIQATAAEAPQADTNAETAPKESAPKETAPPAKKTQPPPKKAQPPPKAQPEKKQRKRVSEDTSNIIKGKRSRKPAKHDGEDSDGKEATKPKKGNKPAVDDDSVPKKQRPTFPNGYKTSTKKTEEMFATLLQKIEGGDVVDSEEEDTATMSKNKKGKKGKGVPAKVDEGMSDAHFTLLLGEKDRQIAFLENLVSEKNKQIDKLQEQLDGEREKSTMMYMRGVRDMKGIPDTPPKKT
jgi:hypothetical protein